MFKCLIHHLPPIEAILDFVLSNNVLNNFESVISLKVQIDDIQNFVNLESGEKNTLTLSITLSL